MVLDCRSTKRSERRSNYKSVRAVYVKPRRCVSSGPSRGSQRHGVDVQRGLGAAAARHTGAEGREEQPEGRPECGEGAGARSQVHSRHQIYSTDLRQLFHIPISQRFSITRLFLTSL